MRTRTLAPLLPALAALAVLAACGGTPSLAAPQPPPSSPSPSPSPEVSDWPHQPALEDAALRVERVGRAHYSGQYGGVELDVPGDLVLIHRVPPAPAFERAASAAAGPAVRVRYVTAAYSEARLADGARTLDRDAARWQAHGATLHSVGPRMGECVEVGIEHPDRHGAMIIAAYPTIPLCVIHNEGSEPL